MALSSVPYVPKDGVILLEDASASPIALTVAYENGDFSFGPIRQAGMSVTHFKDRGIFYSARLNEEEPIDFSFSAHATEFADGTEKCILDAVRGTGAFAAGDSWFGGSAEVWALRLTFSADTSGIGGDASTVVLTYAICECSFSEGTPGTFSVSGQAVLRSSAGVAIT